MLCVVPSDTQCKVRRVQLIFHVYAPKRLSGVTTKSQVDDWKFRATQTEQHWPKQSDRPPTAPRAHNFLISQPVCGKQMHENMWISPKDISDKHGRKPKWGCWSCLNLQLVCEGTLLPPVLLCWGTACRGCVCCWMPCTAAPGWGRAADTLHRTDRQRETAGCTGDRWTEPDLGKGQCKMGYTVSAGLLLLLHSSFIPSSPLLTQAGEINGEEQKAGRREHRHLCTVIIRAVWQLIDMQVPLLQMVWTPQTKRR